MEFQLFLAFAIISMWIPVYGIESSGEAYWKMNLGNDVIMPNVVKESLLGRPPGTDEKYDVDNGRSSLSGFKIYGRPPGTDEKYDVDNGRSSLSGFKIYGLARSNRPTLVYNTKGSKLTTDNSIVYFFEKELVHPGSKMKLLFSMGVKEAKFKPLKVSDSIPFSSNKIAEILKLFAIKPKSTTASLIEETLSLCEYSPVKGEQKYCATSLEAMVNHVKSRLGDQVTVLSTEVDTETSAEYKIENAKKIKNKKNLVCHKMNYPYAVFYCHTLSKTDVYQVSLIDGTGKNVRAVAVCHKDTSPWNPGHIAFQILKVKPGGVPICHFLSPDAIIWVTQ